MSNDDRKSFLRQLGRKGSPSIARPNHQFDRTEPDHFFTPFLDAATYWICGKCPLTSPYVDDPGAHPVIIEEWPF